MRGHALDRDCFERGIGKDDFLETGRGRITFVGGVEILPEHLAHSGQLGKEIGQDAIDLGVDRVFAVATREAFAHLRM